MEKYWYIFLASCKDTLFYRSKIIANTGIWFFRMLILMFIYSYAYELRGDQIKGIDFTEAVWSFAVYFIVVSTGVRYTYRNISDDVRLGEIETKLNKPFHYLLYMVTSRWGKGLPQFVFSFLVTIPFLYLLIGSPDVSFSFLWFVSVFFLFAGGIVLAFLIYLLVGLTAIWIDHAEPVHWFCDKTIMVLGGAYVPVALFPPLARTIAEATPFGATMFVTHVFNPGFLARWTHLFFLQVFWIAVLFLLLFFVYRISNKKLSIHGG